MMASSFCWMREMARERVTKKGFVNSFHTVHCGRKPQQRKFNSELDRRTLSYYITFEHEI